MAMWNIMAIQDLNYKGVTHDPKLFESMCEYWTLRRASEAEGKTFMSVEEFMKTHEFKEGDMRERDIFNKDDPRVHEVDVPALQQPRFKVPVNRSPEIIKDHVTTEAAKNLLNTVLDKPKEFTNKHLLGSGVLDKARQDASEGLARVMNISVDQAKLAIESAEQSFTSSTLTELEVTMSQPTKDSLGGFIVGKTDRPVEELQEEAKKNIDKHTSERNKENAELDALIAHPSHRRFIKAKQDEAFRAGYAKAQEELRTVYNPYLGQCGDPDCECND